MPTYEVALWHYWHPLDPLIMEDLPLLASVQAEDPYDALYSFMTACKLKRVGHAAIQCPGPDGVLLRYDDVTLPVDPVMV